MYNVSLQKNKVFIGMEDVSVTYHDAQMFENISLTEVVDVVTKAANDFANDEQVVRLMDNKSYYPIQWNMPCRAVITLSDTPKVERDVNFYSDINRTLNNLSKAKEFFEELEKEGDKER